MKALAWLVVAALAVAAAIYQLRHTPVVNDLLVRLGLMEVMFEVPQVRTLTDSEGRTIETEVIGFSPSAVAVRRLADNQKFVIEFAKLSDADREIFSSMEPQRPDLVQKIRDGEMEEEELAARRKRLAGRHATWHRDIQVAKRDAETSRLPLCLVFLETKGDLSDQLDRFVIRSEEFRKWANTRVVLCLYYNDPQKFTARAGLDSATKAEARHLANLYGVGSHIPSFVILNVDATVRGTVSSYKGEATSVIIDRLEDVLDK